MSRLWWTGDGKCIIGKYSSRPETAILSCKQQDYTYGWNRSKGSNCIFWNIYILYKTLFEEMIGDIFPRWSFAGEKFLPKNAPQINPNIVQCRSDATNIKEGRRKKCTKPFPEYCAAQPLCVSVKWGTSCLNSFNNIYYININFNITNEQEFIHHCIGFWPVFVKLRAGESLFPGNRIFN